MPCRSDVPASTNTMYRQFAQAARCQGHDSAPARPVAQRHSCVDAGHGAYWVRFHGCLDFSMPRWTERPGALLACPAGLSWGSPCWQAQPHRRDATVAHTLCEKTFQTLFCSLSATDRGLGTKPFCPDSQGWCGEMSCRGSETAGQQRPIDRASSVLQLANGRAGTRTFLRSEGRFCFFFGDAVVSSLPTGCCARNPFKSNATQRATVEQPPKGGSKLPAPRPARTALGPTALRRQEVGHLWLCSVRGFTAVAVLGPGPCGSSPRRNPSSAPKANGTGSATLNNNDSPWLQVPLDAADSIRCYQGLSCSLHHSPVTLDRQRAVLCYQEFVNGHVLATLLAYATLLNTAKRRLRRRAISRVLTIRRSALAASS